MDTPMMKCGHAANATTKDKDGNTIPCCAICAGIVEGAYIIEDKQIDLNNRKAACSSCGKLTESNTNLAFFEHRPNKETDIYYCGCHGWD